MAFAERLSGYFEDFAVDAILDGVPVRGLSDGPTAVAHPGQLGVMAATPVFTLPTADVPDQPVGKTLVIGAATWLVARHDHDGTGISALHLERP